MKKLKQRWDKFKVWRTVCHYSKIKQWLIFFGVIHCGWFEMFPY